MTRDISEIDSVILLTTSVLKECRKKEITGTECSYVCSLCRIFRSNHRVFFFNFFRCGVSLFIVILVIYTYRNR